MGAENSEYLLKRIEVARRIHPSWLLAAASAGFLIGAASAVRVQVFFSGWWLLAASLFIIIAFYQRGKVGIGLILLAGCLLGQHRGIQEVRSQIGYEDYLNKVVMVIGRVAEDPTIDVDGDLRLRLADVRIDGQKLGGQLWVVLAEAANLQRSDVVQVEGRLTEGFGTIPATMYQADLIDKRTVPGADYAREVRDVFAGEIRQVISEPEASLAAGFLVGQKSTLPEKLEQELRLLGLTHIVVASGYNLTILVRFARKFFAKISRFTALALSSGLVICFAMITGFGPSMSRASLIALLSLVAWYFGRKIHPIVLLTVTAAATVAVQPAYAWGDVGWLLSFTSFIGVIILAPIATAYFWGSAQPKGVSRVFVETLSAQLVTLPIIAFVFGQYSPLALLANALILPLIPLTMALTFIAASTSFVSLWLGAFLAWPAETLLRYMVVLVDRLSQWPLASSEIAFSPTAVITFYCGLLCLIIFMKRRSGYELKNASIIE